MITLKWISSYDMTDKEKLDHPEYIKTKGYLKRIGIHEAAKEWWSCLSEEEKIVIKLIPNFDPDIFEQITGIKIDNWSKEGM